jgi:uncharacterized membrane protein YdfJ with MMPL/SSD domain
MSMTRADQRGSAPARRPLVTAQVSPLGRLGSWSYRNRRLAFTDAGTNPSAYTSRQAYDLIAKGFGPGTNGPLVVALSLPGPAGQATVTSLRTDLASQPNVAYVSAPQYNVNR